MPTETELLEKIKKLEAENKKLRENAEIYKLNQQKLDAFFSQSLIGFFFMLLDEPVEWNDKIDKEKALDYIFANQRITKINKAMLDQYGAKEKDFIGLTPNDFFKHDIEQGRKTWKDFFNNGHLKVETDERRFNGEKMLIEGDYICLYDEQKRIIGHFGVQQDVTVRKKNEQKLKETNQHLLEERKLFEQGNVIIFKWNNKEGWPVEFVSENVFNIIGYTPNEIKAPEFEYSKLIHPEDVEFVTKEVSEGSKNKSNSFEHKPYRLINKNGDNIWVKDYTVIIRNKNNVITDYLGYLVDITELVETENALKESEARWKFAIDGSNLGLWDWNMITNEVYFSDYWKKMLGFEPDEIKNSLEEWDKRVHPKDKEKTFADINKHINGEAEIYKNEHRVETKNGSYRWILDRGKIVSRTEEGKPARMIGTHTDVTDRRNYEDNLKESEERYKLILEGSKVGTWDWDIETGEINRNHQWAEMFGYKYEESQFDEKKWIDLVHPDDRKKLWDSLKKHLSGETSQHKLEYRILTKKGDYLWILDQAKVVEKDENNSPMRMSGTHSNIHETKTIEEELKANEEKLRTFMNNTTDAIRFTDEQGNIIYVNNAHSELTGYEEIEVLNTNIRDFIYKLTPDNFKNEEIYKKITEELKHLLKGNFNDYYIKPHEVEIRRKNGESLVLQESIFKIKTQKGYRLGSILRDNTLLRNKELKIKEQNKQLKELIKLKDRFFNIIAHDLRNPFNSLLGFSEMLHNEFDSLDIDEKKQIIKALFESSKNTFELVENLLDWSRAQSGKMKFEPIVLNLKKNANNAIASCLSTAKNKNIKINNNISNNLDIIADKDMLSTIIRNIVSNAVKYTNEGGSIILNANIKNDFIEISIKDDGVGIEENRKNNIFDFEKKISTEGTNEEQGTGLGLILCKEFVDKHQGEIWVESEIGNGSEFFFTIPQSPIGATSL